VHAQCDEQHGGGDGTRAWLGKRRFAWLTAARLRKVTVVLFGAALIASALLMSGSGAAHH
jgi:hypothetical protein